MPPSANPAGAATLTCCLPLSTVIRPPTIDTEFSPFVTDRFMPPRPSGVICTLPPAMPGTFTPGTDPPVFATVIWSPFALFRSSAITSARAMPSVSSLPVVSSSRAPSPVASIDSLPPCLRASITPLRVTIDTRLPSCKSST
ncbi:hypothetical protein DM47_2248 [Burkholderia mallei]|nr:hypothetical protein DM45_3019 [Burkholderia mallei]KOT13269.1 hypothetical protein DM77_4559 [Burkholderia mallei]KOT18543.1 hypothetical protein DM47_2248 [Burkholderia mallei]KOT24552.1 hypothetical protein DM52_3922 [Burkholderia mallei]